jgi:uncharacterized damage-inducible protein DinB
MISPDYVRVMAGYNLAVNDIIFTSAALLSDRERQANRGAFWKSIHGTLAHLLWADRVQMHRLAGWTKPVQSLRASGSVEMPFDQLARDRAIFDHDLLGWAEALTPQDLDGAIRWHSGALQREITTSRVMLIAHLFNHQTHHRGQVHALLTRAGVSTHDTDLWIIMSGS